MFLGDVLRTSSGRNFAKWERGIFFTFTVCYLEIILRKKTRIILTDL